MAQGTNIAVVMEYIGELEERVRSVLPMEDVRNIATEARGGNAEVEIRLVGASERSMGSAELADRIRKEVAGTVPGADFRVSAQSGPWMLRRIFSSGGGNEAVQLELRGCNIEQADRLAQEIKLRMERVDGVEGVRIGREEGRPEQNIIFERDKISRLGLSIQQVAALSRRTWAAHVPATTASGASSTRSVCAFSPRIA